ncbi:hypothetical protein [Halobellus rubicundus]|uniref:Uncharacterized protein n=1 Tax=Halobellus rubicundus TaxID=2996466 RepID=A0ABD5MBA9_9EURY
MTEPRVSEHVRVDGDEHPPGVYRVVGVDDETVTLLRVSDADGARAHTGELLTVDTGDFADFEPATEPPSDASVASRLASLAETAYWSVRAFGQQLAAHPLPAAAAGLVVAIGAVGDAFVSLPDPVFGGLIFVGSLGLAYVGNGLSL